MEKDEFIEGIRKKAVKGEIVCVEKPNGKADVLVQNRGVLVQRVSGERTADGNIVYDHPILRWRNTPLGAVLFMIRNGRQNIIYEALSAEKSLYIVTGSAEEYNDEEVADVLGFIAGDRQKDIVWDYMQKINNMFKNGKKGKDGLHRVKRTQEDLFGLLHASQALITLMERNPHALIHKSREGRVAKSCAYNNHGYAYLKLEQFELALPSLDVARNYDRKGRFINNNMAEAFEGLGELERAKKYYQRELEITPKHPTARKSLERICAQ